MVSKRPWTENGGAADAPDCESCNASEAAPTPTVPSSSGRSLRKRPWEEEGFRCPFLDTINRTLLDFGVLLAPPHVSRLRSHRQLPSRGRFREGLLDHWQQLQRVRVPRVWQVLPRPRHAHAGLHARAPGASRRLSAAAAARASAQRSGSARAGRPSRVQEPARRQGLLPA